MVAAVLEQQSQWSGMLPPPQDFAQYPPHVQERMMRWNDATTTDESTRQDQLVAAEIEASKTGPNRALAFATLCVVLAFVLFIVGEPVGGGLMLGVPVFTFTAQLIQSVRSRSSRTDDQAPRAVPPEAPDLSSGPEAPQINP